jgi:superfamily II DNA or RNA helicase
MNNKKTREDIQKECLDIMLQHKRGTAAISMGVGKTRIAIQYLQYCYNPLIEILIVIPKLSIATTWIDELEKMNLQSLTKHIKFTTYISINKHNPDDYDIVCLDECHNLLESHTFFLSAFKGKILGLTGTPPKYNDSEKGRMVNKYCPIKYTFTIDEATDSKILNDYQIVVHKLELSKLSTLKKTKKQGGFWWTSERKDYEYITERCNEAESIKAKQLAAIMRMRALMEYATKEDYVKLLLTDLTDKCIIFANTQKQADKLSKHSYHSGNSKNEENLELFSDGRIDRLSCVLQLSEGVTIPNLKQGIIMHAYGNERKSSQRIGRLLRLNPTEKATCHILCYKDTQDELWVQAALKDFDSKKVKYYNPLNK